jgi:hypothetical protein
MEIASVFWSKLKICIRNVAFSAMTPKTRVQEEVIKKTPPLFQEMGFQNLLTITFPPSKGIGERISEGILTE